MKECKRCNQHKNLADFKKDNRAKDGKASLCKSCAASYAKANRNNWSGQDGKYCPERYFRTKAGRIKTILAWQKRNPEKCNEISSRRRAKLRDQTPELTEEEKKRVQDFYWLAKDLKAVTGEEYHVDHIHPISKGGLHHPSNLQILPSDLNLKKSNKVHLSAEGS